MYTKDLDKANHTTYTLYILIYDHDKALYSIILPAKTISDVRVYQ